jgi:hypothetical protein
MLAHKPFALLFCVWLTGRHAVLPQIAVCFITAADGLRLVRLPCATGFHLPGTRKDQALTSGG